MAEWTRCWAILVLLAVSSSALQQEQAQAQEKKEKEESRAATTEAQAQGQGQGQGSRPSWCAERLAACSSAHRTALYPRRRVCGDDGVTYPSRCHLMKAQCEGAAVALKHKGACKEPQPCWAHRRHAQLVKRPAQLQMHEPLCLEDGSYAPVQCHAETGYCWCVSPNGRPVPNTSIKHELPKCGRKGKSGTRRRSSPGNRKHKKDCNRNERSLFVSSLMHHFQVEYKRLSGSESAAPAVVATEAVAAAASEEDSESAEAPPPPILPSSLSSSSSSSPPSTPTVKSSPPPNVMSPERAVLAWKFSQLDGDADGALDRQEVAPLRRLVRKALKPRRCARAFPRLCDRDADRALSRDEWFACLRLDFNHEILTEGPGSPSKDEGEWKKHPSTRALLRDTLSQLKVVRRTSIQILQGSMSAKPGFGEDSPDTKEEPEANDCFSDRKTVLDEQISTTGGFYVPECTPDGRYRKIQCYNSTGYCWCVYEDTGAVMPGTSVKDQKPNCDIVPPPSRPMSGCPEPKKQAFLRELLEFMRKKMASSKDKTLPESVLLSLVSNGGSHEAVATWTFQTVDRNKNKIWERKEWKNFRTLVMTQPQLRRCGKRLPRYCDVNNDQKISLTEWLNCISLNLSTSASSTKPSPTNRTGTNPLITYLSP